ncbi:MAG: S8 family serine peptidase [Acidobacteriota bacterium]
MPRSLSRFVHSLLLVLVSLPFATPTQARLDDGALLGGTSLYLVHLDGAPGALARPDLVAEKSRFSASAPAVRAYLGELDGLQRAALSRVAGALGRDVAPRFHYRLVGNAVALALTPAEARRLGKVEGLRVEADQLFPLDTLESTEGVGATAVWDGPAGFSTRGEGVVIGIIDSGINFDHPSFSATPEDGFVFQNPLGGDSYLGFCDPDHPEFQPVFACNAKVIGAWDFADGIELNFTDGVYTYTGSEDDGPVDDNGHGSAVAGVAAGNGVDALGIIGTAPRAHLVSYDACISVLRSLPPLVAPFRTGQGVCPRSATMAAIEQAILDGVDVLNYSISGGTVPWQDNDRVFLDAIDAGIFVAASAGNRGPAEGTVGHLGPWMTTVAASVKVQEQPLYGTVEGFVGPPGAPEALRGTGGDPQSNYPDGTGRRDLVYAGDLTCIYSGFGPDCEQQPPRYCTNEFEDDALKDKIVICDVPAGRPAYNTYATMANLIRDDLPDFPSTYTGWPAAVVLVHEDPNAALPAFDFSELTPFPDLPMAFQLSKTDGDALRAWARGDAPKTAAVSALAELPDAPETFASFTSRGPNPSFDVMKPDLAAPGRNILTANRGEIPEDDEPPASTTVISGTSFSSPHVAGAAALLKALHPTWTPGQIRSALMTTTETALFQEGTLRPARGGETGSGRIDVSAAVRAPLALDETKAAYLAADPAQDGEPESLNVPSMHNSSCAVSCRFERTVTNVSGAAGTWTVAPSGHPAISLTATPGALNLDAGESATLQITATPTAGAPTEAWELLYLELGRPGFPTTRLPLSLGATNGQVPERLALDVDGTAGQRRITGLGTRDLDAPALSLRVRGGVPLERSSSDIPQDSTPSNPVDNLAEVWVFPFTVAQGTDAALVETLETTSPDLDLFILQDQNGDLTPSQTEIVCQSGSADSKEQCLLENPPAGQYWAIVQNFTASDAGVDAATLGLAQIAGGATGDAVTVTGPESAAAFTPFDVILSYDLPALADGLTHLALLDVGTDAASPTDVGTAVLVISPTGLDGGLIFADGFESGDLSAWSALFD